MRSGIPKTLAGWIGDQKPETAAADAQSLLATSDFRDHMLLPPVEPPSLEFWMDLVYHELGHAVGNLVGGAENISVLVRRDGSGGWCRHGPLERLEDYIVSTLAGILAEAKRRPSSIHQYAHGAYDLITARQLIDQYNVRGTSPPMSYERAAQLAMNFVDAHWATIETLAIVLNHSGKLCDHDIRLFARCRS